MAPAFADFLLAIAVRTAIVLIALTLGLRMLGKREIGDLNVLDVVLLLAVANAVQNAMTAGKGDLTVGIVSAGSLLAAGRLLSALWQRYPGAEQRASGAPTVLVSNGNVFRAVLRREGITGSELMSA